MVKKAVQIPSFCTIFEKLPTYWRIIGANSFLLHHFLRSFRHIGTESVQIPFFAPLLRSFRHFGAESVQNWCKKEGDSRG